MFPFLSSSKQFLRFKVASCVFCLLLLASSIGYASRFKETSCVFMLPLFWSLQKSLTSSCSVLGLHVDTKCVLKNAACIFVQTLSSLLFLASINCYLLRFLTYVLALLLPPTNRLFTCCGPEVFICSSGLGRSCWNTFLLRSQGHDPDHDSPHWGAELRHVLYSLCFWYASATAAQPAWTIWNLGCELVASQTDKPEKCLLHGVQCWTFLSWALVSGGLNDVQCYSMFVAWEYLLGGGNLSLEYWSVTRTSMYNLQG